MSDSATLPILFEDERFIAVDKPPGLLSIPGQDSREPSALLRLAKIFPKRRFLVVHRIDRETSGVLLFAKDEASHRLANDWFSSHTIRKEYLAIAQGNPRLPALRVNRPIEGKNSLSQVQVVERFPEAFLARVRIATGRRHQIRIHLQAEGFPLMGDVRYGGVRTFDGIGFSRVALHAEKLALPDGSAEIVSPWPEDFRRWIDSLRSLSSARGEGA